MSLFRHVHVSREFSVVIFVIDCIDSLASNCVARLSIQSVRLRHALYFNDVYTILAICIHIIAVTLFFRQSILINEVALSE